jgi:CRP-like cAMP-binding protein
MTFRQPEFESILTNVSKSISLNTNEIEYFLSLLKIEKVPKKSYILKEGQLCDKITFVCNGILRAYYADSNDKQSTIMFAVEDWWITDMYCFLNARAAMLFIEAVDNSTVIHLSKSSLDNLYAKIPKFEKFFRIIMQNAYVREQLRTIQNLSLTAEERYENFLKKYPQVAKQVTQKHIASYLGITPEFLSVLRSRKN